MIKNGLCVISFNYNAIVNLLCNVTNWDQFWDLWINIVQIM